MHCYRNYDFLHKREFFSINYVGQRQRFTVTKQELCSRMRDIISRRRDSE